MNFDLEVFSLSRPDIRAGFVPSEKQVFKETGEVTPVPIPGHNRRSFVPWGADNLMPYQIMDLVDSDETVSQCHRFLTECVYAQGLRYDTVNATKDVQDKVRLFCDYSNITDYYLGVCSDLMMYDWAVTIVHLTPDLTRIASITRREVMHCRFEYDSLGRRKTLLYGQWNANGVAIGSIEMTPILDYHCPMRDLMERVQQEGCKNTRYAIISAYPSSNPSWYPIPAYGSIFKSLWYDIKRLIAMAKYNKLKNAAPLKYLIEIEDGFWEKHLERKGITDEKKAKEEIQNYKKTIVEFLSGAENSGKSLFSGFYCDPNGNEVHEIKITNLENKPAGGDWESDIQEAANIICFAMGVHPNVIGAVPGKAQTNNSGSDKRELFIMSQARKKPYRDLLFEVQSMIVRFNRWDGVEPVCPLTQLTTLDEHTDSKEVTEN